MQGKVEICGVNTAHLPRLDSRETEALLARARAGDAGAREALISGNLRLVLSVIQKFTGRSENVDDLFQVGCVGLIKAIDNFDPAHEVKFSTYGVPMTIEWRKTDEEVLIHDTQTGAFPCNSSTFWFGWKRGGHCYTTYAFRRTTDDKVVRGRHPGQRRAI